MSLCLFILMIAPVVTVVGYECKGHRHQVESSQSDARFF